MHSGSICIAASVNLNINNRGAAQCPRRQRGHRANETQIPGRNVSLGTITLTGCLTVDVAFSRASIMGISSTIATGDCSGTVGNNGSAAMQYAQAAASPCGLPLSGFIYGRQTYNLRSDCVLSGTLYIPYESNVVINGNKYTIDASAAGSEPIGSRVGEFSLKNAVISGATGFAACHLPGQDDVHQPTRNSAHNGGAAAQSGQRHQPTSYGSHRKPQRQRGDSPKRAPCQQACYRSASATRCLPRQYGRRRRASCRQAQARTILVWA